MLILTVFIYLCSGMDTRLTEDYAQYQSKQHLSNSLLEKAVSGDFYLLLHYTCYIIVCAVAVLNNRKTRI